MRAIICTLVVAAFAVPLSASTVYNVANATEWFDAVGRARDTDSINLTGSFEVDRPAAITRSQISIFGNGNTITALQSADVLRFQSQGGLVSNVNFNTTVPTPTDYVAFIKTNASDVTVNGCTFAGNAAPRQSATGFLGVYGIGVIPRNLTVTNSTFNNVVRGVEINRKIERYPQATEAERIAAATNGGKLLISGNNFVGGYTLISIDMGNDAYDINTTFSSDGTLSNPDNFSLISDNNITGISHLGIAIANASGVNIIENGKRARMTTVNAGPYPRGDPQVVHIENSSSFINVRDNRFRIAGDGMAISVRVATEGDPPVPRFDNMSDIVIDGNNVTGTGKLGIGLSYVDRVTVTDNNLGSFTPRPDRNHFQIDDEVTFVDRAGNNPSLLQDGDLSQNDRIDQADLNIVLNNWLTTPTRPGSWYEGDPNRDGLVDRVDLDFVLDNWPSPGSPDFVPSEMGFLAGDTNIDGKLDSHDLSVLSQNYNLSFLGYRYGDFDHNGIVNFADLLAYVQNADVLPPIPLDSSDDFATDWSRAIATVPEPSGVLLVISGLSIALQRRETNATNK